MARALRQGGGLGAGSRQGRGVEGRGVGAEKGDLRWQEGITVEP